MLFDTETIDADIPVASTDIINVFSDVIIDSGSIEKLMFVIMSYDLGEKRVRKSNKIVKKYLQPMQRSMFEGYITEKQLKNMKQELEKIIFPDHDKVMIYKIFNDKMLETDEIGVFKSKDMIL